MLRVIKPSDWPTIAYIQQTCYPHALLESVAVLQNKQQLAPHCCFVFEHQQQTVGYCFAHPWIDNQAPSLHQALAPNDAASTLYLHDVALLPQGRGQGLVHQLLHHLEQFTRISRYCSLSLVAVAGADRYWQKLGFTPCSISKDLNIYGDKAQYMRRELSD
ncbi:GNAT family N-acetyltransferase [Shewanella avicenniae]|uniref:GNAT family N-acetyltransferase n=1 Tax=Shewanella avicenniae TaxID=2814294 RepID=A0ABX7QT08_9GAMM|nr:GNAT family N-acetyltransferase [Shewanella avicenniae]QSX34593.1 GNAT family N-acetyltransferase [Shewanella avicenniae]